MIEDIPDCVVSGKGYSERDWEEEELREEISVGDGLCDSSCKWEIRDEAPNAKCSNILIKDDKSPQEKDRRTIRVQLGGMRGVESRL